jgi:hypothetical protein
VDEHESLDVKNVYDDVCRRHDGIADFRAKLLTLLPIASGAWIFLLIGKDALAGDFLVFRFGLAVIVRQKGLVHPAVEISVE